MSSSAWGTEQANNFLDPDHLCDIAIVVIDKSVLIRMDTVSELTNDPANGNWERAADKVHREMKPPSVWASAPGKTIKGSPMSKRANSDGNLCDNPIVVIEQSVLVRMDKAREFKNDLADGNWERTWQEGLEDASRLYFGEGNVSGMIDLLLPLHEKLENEAETQKENVFVKSFGRDLAEAHKFVREYVRIVTSGGVGIPTQGDGSNPSIAQYDESGNLVRYSEEAETAMNKAWDIYYKVFRWTNRQLQAQLHVLTKLDFNQSSPALSNPYSM
jgi:hypothetical protein